MAPGYDKVRANLGDVYLKQGKAEAALGLCDDYLRAPLKIPPLNFDRVKSRYHDSRIRGMEYGPTGIF